MKRNETIYFARIAGITGIFIGGVLLCSILFLQMALYFLNNGLQAIHH